MAPRISGSTEQCKGHYTGTNTRLLLLGKLSLDLFLMKAISSEISKYIWLPKRQLGPKIFRSITITFFFPLTLDSSLYYGVKESIILAFINMLPFSA